MSEQLYRLAKRVPAVTKSAIVIDDDTEEVGGWLHDLVDEEDKLRKSFALIGDFSLPDIDLYNSPARIDEDDSESSCSNTNASFDDSELFKEFTEKEKGQKQKITEKVLNEAIMNEAHTQEVSKIADVCGHIALNRIVEIRRAETIMLDSNMSDEKASRYNSKQSLNLGRFTIHTALRPDLRNHSRDGVHMRRRAGANHGDNSHKRKGFLYSLEPVIIQQDQYCLSTARPEEYHKWPPKSSYIIHNSKFISPELAVEYEKTFLKATTATSFPNALLDSFNALGDESVNNDTPTVSFSPSALSPSNQPLAATSVNNQDDYGCLRKIVLRGPPYDFAVDRRCVWKFCLFEQFSENYMQLSSKEKQATKLMETATMALKLSKLNREGARLHMQSRPDEHLPALVGGEKFARTLRDITLKTSQKTQNEYFRDRRIRELKVHEYFQHRINHHIRHLDPDESPPRSVDLRESSTESKSFLTESGMLENQRQRRNINFPMAETIIPGSQWDEQSHNSNSQNNSVWDDPAETMNRRKTGMVSASVALAQSRQSSLASMDSFSSQNSGGQPDGSQLHRSFSQDSMPEIFAGYKEISLSPMKNVTNLSEDIRKTFDLRDYQGDRKNLVMNSAESVKSYKEFSAGEQIMSLHRTMSHLNVVAKVSFFMLTTVVSCEIHVSILNRKNSFKANNEPLNRPRMSKQNL
jgi:hypothetical protein